IMEATYNGPRSKARLITTPGYIAAPGFIQDVSWKPDKGGNYLVNRQLQDNAKEGPTTHMVCVVAGKVSDDKLFTSPVGNYTPKYNSSVSEAKFQFTLTAPSNPDFGPDWAVAIKTLQECQTVIAKGDDHRFFILSDETDNLNF
ncbi:hypothetical protein H0H81_004043, partial [Sphagnurus paluster]